MIIKIIIIIIVIIAILIIITNPIYSPPYLHFCHHHVPPGVDVSLQKWNPRLEEEVLPWDFVSRAAFQLGAANPRHKITSGYNEGLTDVIRDFMDIINRLGTHNFLICSSRPFISLF